MIDQIGPLAGQVKSPRERVELNGMIGATRKFIIESMGETQEIAIYSHSTFKGTCP